MATFPNIAPTYNSVKRSAPKVLTTSFGDGYEQRVRFGINTNPKRYDLQFEVSDVQGQTIETFLDDRAADANSFTFTPPGESTPLKFVCRSWNRTNRTSTRVRIDATFDQVFEV